MPILHWTCSRIDTLSFITVVPSYYHFFTSQSHIIWISFYLETSSLEPFSLFYDLIASDYTKGEWQWRQDYLFCHIILLRKCFFTSAYFSPFDLRNLLTQKLSSLKAKFYFCDWKINVSIFSNVTRLADKVNLFLIQKWEENIPKLYFCIRAPTFLTHM